MRLGIDRFDELKRYLRGRRVGLLTHLAAVDRDLVPTMQRFQTDPDIKLAALFGPEHGLKSTVQDTLPVGHETDHKQPIPVYSLFGPVDKPTPEMLSKIDVFVCDLQDVGVRFYTYTTTLALSLAACAEAGVEVIVLDRPNPLGGQEVQGPVLRDNLRSFLGWGRIPIQHGMTIGELSRFYNDSLEVGANLTVWKMAGWRRDMTWDKTGSPGWFLPSPNLPAFETAVVYPGTCLFEGTSITEGRGTTRPFEIVGAPWLNPFDFAHTLNEQGMEGVGFRPLYFTPTFWRYQGTECGGVQIHVTDRHRFRPIESGLRMVAAARETAPEAFAWRLDDQGRNWFDLLSGDTTVRQQVELGVDVSEIVAGWQADVDAFTEERQSYLLYE